MSGVLTAFYDLAHGPVSFDFVAWLVRAMKEQARQGCSGLHVVIVPKEDGLGGFARHWGKHDEHATRWRLWNIVLAACPLAGATVTLAASRAQAERLKHKPLWWPEPPAHFMGPLVGAARAGEAIPKLQPTPAAERYVELTYGGITQPIVTLTLRQQDTDPARNSDLMAWFLFARWLMAQGYQVININEARIALERGRGYAEFSLDLRLALYRRAAMNIIGNNGPGELLRLSDAPYLQFGVALPAADWEKHYAERLELRTGDQLPWAGPNQRLVYREDTYHNMVEEFERWAGATS